ncbi:MAG: YqhV family protein [Thermaerobacter sp.]|nr:YqhV family protein [Thermaerobacter sp.]
MSDQVFLRGMIAVRVISALVELTGAFLMWRYDRLDLAIRINGVLGIAGPVILTVTMLLGMAGLAAGKFPLDKMTWIGAGVILIMWGTSR